MRWSRVIAAGLATGTIAHAMHMLVCVADMRITTPMLFAFHWTVAVVLHVLAAVASAGRFDNRLWSAVLFLFPITVVSAREFETLLGPIGWLGVVGGALVVGAAAVGLSKRRASPFWAALAGSAAGSLIPFIHFFGYVRRIDDVVLVLAAGATIAGAVAVAILAGRPAGAWVPPAAFSLRRVAAFGAIAFAAFGLTPSLPPIEPPPDVAGPASPSVVLIVMDTVRADHLELYGYDRETMPALTRFAREAAVVAQNAVANGPSSLPTHASIFTGLYPVRHGAHKPFLSDPTPPPYAYRLHPSIPTLATILARAGYWTVGISANSGPLAPVFGLGQGFQVYRTMPSPRRQFLRNTPWGAQEVTNRWLENLYLAVGALVPAAREYLLGVPYRRAAEITDEALEVAERAGDRALFLFVNYMEAHSPYFPPAPYVDRFPGRSRSLLASGWDPRIRRASIDGEHDLTPQQREHYAALYDGELGYLDDQLDRLLRGLQQRPDWDETLVVITSDHGEALGDHGDLEHSNSLYDEIIRVPLIVKPGRDTPGAPPAGSTIARPIQSVDVFPIVLEHAGVDVPARIDGRAWGAGRREAFSWLYPTLGRGEELRSVERGSWKLIRSSSGRTELYNRKVDPDERLDLSVAESEKTQSLLRAFDGTPDSARRAGSAPPELNRRMTDELRALGYLP